MSDEMAELLERMRAEYVDSVPEKIQKIREARASGDLKRLRTEFHRLRGSGKTFGFPEITRLGESMERAIDRAGDADREQAVDLAIALLEAFGASAGSPPGQPSATPWSLKQTPEWKRLAALLPKAA